MITKLEKPNFCHFSALSAQPPRLCVNFRMLFIALFKAWLNAEPQRKRS